MTQINKKSLLIIFMALLVGFGMQSCKSKKKLAAEKAAQEYAMKVDQAKTDLKSIINDDGSMTLNEKQDILRKTKAQNLNDPEVLSLTREAEAKINKELEIQKEKERLAAKQKEMDSEVAKSLNDYFNDIVNASSPAQANQKIQTALGLFQSPSAPVLIIISQSGDYKDYDRPTTINKYLNYIKDQKKNINLIDNIVYDKNGKIVELELIKQ